MRPQTASITLAAANDVSVAASQTPGGAGALTLTATPVSLDVARRVLITAAGNESAKTFVVTGTDREGNVIRESLTGPNATTKATTQDFKTVSSVTISAAAAGAVKVGTNGVASTKWLMLDHTAWQFNCGVAVNQGGVTANWTIEVTLDEPNRAYTDSTPAGSGDLSTGVGATWTAPVAFIPSGFGPLSADTLVNLTTPVRAIRLTVNSGATSAGTRLTVIQQGRT